MKGKKPSQYHFYNSDGSKAQQNFLGWRVVSGASYEGGRVRTQGLQGVSGGFCRMAWRQSWLNSVTHPMSLPRAPAR